MFRFKIALLSSKVESQYKVKVSDNKWLFFKISMQIGNALGFVIPPEVVTSDNFEYVGHGLSLMMYVGAGVTTFLLILVLICEFEQIFVHENTHSE